VHVCVRWGVAEIRHTGRCSCMRVLRVFVEDTSTQRGVYEHLSPSWALNQALDKSFVSLRHVPWGRQVGRWASGPSFHLADDKMSATRETPHRWPVYQSCFGDGGYRWHKMAACRPQPLGVVVCSSFIVLSRGGEVVMHCLPSSAALEENSQQTERDAQEPCPNPPRIINQPGSRGNQPGSKEGRYRAS